jgi:hypothetical protein
MPWPPLATALIGQREKSAEAVKIETERCHEKPMNYFFLDHLNFHPTLPPSTRQPLPSDPVKVTNESSKETRNKKQASNGNTSKQTQAKTGFEG